MKITSLKIGLAGLALMLSLSGSLADESFLVIANPGVAADSLSPEALKDIYTAKTRYWDNGQAIVIVVLPDKTDAALQQSCGMNGSQFKTFWQRLTFSGRASEPKKAGNAAELVALVAATKGAIALVPADAVLKDVKTMEVKEKSSIATKTLEMKEVPKWGLFTKICLSRRPRSTNDKLTATARSNGRHRTA